MAYAFTSQHKFHDNTTNPERAEIFPYKSQIFAHCLVDFSASKL